MERQFQVTTQVQREGYVVFLAHTDVNCMGEVRMVHSQGSAYLDRLFVRDEYRRSGVGKELLFSAERWAQERRAKSILVVFSPDNRRDLYGLVDFFRRNNYQIHKELSAIKVLRD